MSSEMLRHLGALVSFLAALVFLGAAWAAVRRREEDGAAPLAGMLVKAGLGISLASAGVLIAALWVRGEEVGHAPFQTLYEVLLYGSLCVALCLIVVVLGNRLHDGRTTRSAVAGLLGFVSMVFVMVTLEPVMDTYGDSGLSLPPALQSGFFVPHVMLYLCGYGAAMVAALAAVLHLLVSWDPVGGRLGGPAVVTELDHLAYRNVALAFPFLSLGLALGTAWAWYAWADYWGWDNKEVWALVSWLVFVVYLHLRRVRGWKGRRSSWFIVMGGVAVIFTLLLFGYLPASYFSVHRYAG